MQKRQREASIVVIVSVVEVGDGGEEDGRRRVFSPACFPLLSLTLSAQTTTPKVTKVSLPAFSTRGPSPIPAHPGTQRQPIDALPLSIGGGAGMEVITVVGLGRCHTPQSWTPAL
jgi:hypothetical protein